MSKLSSVYRHLIAHNRDAKTSTAMAARRVMGMGSSVSHNILQATNCWEPTRRDQQALRANYTTTSLSESVYHRVADETLESIVDLLRPLDDGDDEVEIDLSQGVLSIDLGPCRNHMMWVINKQSPNRQLWWSSPIRYGLRKWTTNLSTSLTSCCLLFSGPQRYEWAPDKQDTVGMVVGRDFRVVRGWRRTTCQNADLLQLLHGEILQATGVDVLPGAT